MARVFPLVMLAGCFIKPGPPGIDVDAPAENDAPPLIGNIAFATSASIPPGSLGGISGADALCQMLADKQHLPGKYLAWLSSSTSNAVDRLVGSQGWVRVDGMPFANTTDDLKQGHVLYPLRITEQNLDLLEGGEAALIVATGTGPDGNKTTSFDCSGFTSVNGSTVTGFADAGGTHWTASSLAPATQNCNMPMHIYCFGVGQQVEVGAVPESSKIAFVTDASEAIKAQGIMPFDTQCDTEAHAAGLTGTFRAAIATTSAAARTRFMSNGPWVRRDGVTTVRGDFIGFAAPIVLNARGELVEAVQVWNGAGTLVTHSMSSMDNCTEWTLTTNTGIVGDTSRSSQKSFGGNTHVCTGSAHIYCLQD